LIAKDLDVSIDSLNSQQIIAWMEEDSKVKREKGQEYGKLSW
jgi:hypothetical protein